MFDTQAFLDKIAPVFGGKKFSIPLPTEDYNTKLQKRIAFRNESSLYLRKCDKTDKQILAIYPEDAPFPVYSPETWFGDSWDARDYGQEYDFNRPFFEQFVELRKKVPHLSLISKNNENCDYTNIIGDCKNCYLIYGSINCEDCYYGNPFDCTDCCDSLGLRNSELCLECVDSNRLYSCAHCQNCSNSRDLLFCYDVNNSEHCFGSAGLNRKKFCFFNEQLTEEDYKKRVADLNLKDPNVLAQVKERFEAIKTQTPRRYYNGTNNENVSGDNIYSSKDCENVYFAENCRDVKDSFQIEHCTDAMDVDHAEYAELNYACMALHGNVRLNLFCYFNWVNTENLLYCGHCYQNVKNSFGSVCLRNAEYCILNKQYTKEEYEELIPKIIEHMMSTGEWGKFFPPETSPFAYNETIANDYYPLTKEEVLKRGWKWKDINEAPGRPGEGRICEISGKAFRIIPQEAKFYERFGLDLPTKSPKVRNLERIALRNPMVLHERTCDQTRSSLLSTYGPTRPEMVYSEEAYTQYMA